MVVLNFSDNPSSISIPFPKAGVWREMVDDDRRTLTLNVPSDGAMVTVQDVPSHYGFVFVA
jgi:hypothetical protein